MNLKMIKSNLKYNQFLNYIYLFTKLFNISIHPIESNTFYWIYNNTFICLVIMQNLSKITIVCEKRYLIRSEIWSDLFIKSWNIWIWYLKWLRLKKIWSESEYYRVFSNTKLQYFNLLFLPFFKIYNEKWIYEILYR